MVTNARVWRVLSFEERQYAGNRGYADDPRRLYTYDSLVANHRQLDEGHVLFVFDRDRLIGLGAIEAIDKRDHEKEHLRCPTCRSTAIKERRKKMPLFRCQKCKSEFEDPQRTVAPCVQYTARYEGTFVPARQQLTKEDVRDACLRWSDQLSIQEMDHEAAVKLVRGDPLLLRVLAARESEADEVSDAELAVEKQAGRQRSGQYKQSAEERKAIELRAMGVAKEYYAAEDWAVEDVSGHQSYDLLCTRQNGERLQVEVKGTTSDGAEVLLTVGEAREARLNHPDVALFVLAHVDLRTEGGGPIARGGLRRVLDAWRVDDGDLVPLGYRYRVPLDGITDADSA